MSQVLFFGLAQGASTACVIGDVIGDVARFDNYLEEIAVTNSVPNHVPDRKRSCTLCTTSAGLNAQAQPAGRPSATGFRLKRMLKHSLSPGLLKKVQMQGGARGEARGVLGPYVAAPREHANAPPAAAEAAGRDVGPFSAAC